MQNLGNVPHFALEGYRFCRRPILHSPSVIVNAFSKLSQMKNLYFQTSFTGQFGTNEQLEIYRLFSDGLLHQCIIHLSCLHPSHEIYKLIYNKCISKRSLLQGLRLSTVCFPCKNSPDMLHELPATVFAFLCTIDTRSLQCVHSIDSSVCRAGGYFVRAFSALSSS